MSVGSSSFKSSQGLGSFLGRGLKKKFKHIPAPRLGVWLLTLQQPLPNFLKEGAGIKQNCRISSLWEYLAEHPAWNPTVTTDFKLSERIFTVSQISLNEALDKVPEIWSCHNSFGSMNSVRPPCQECTCGMPRCKTYWDSAKGDKQAASHPHCPETKLCQNHISNLCQRKLENFALQKNSPEGK